MKRSNKLGVYVYKIISFNNYIYSPSVFSAGWKVSITCFCNKKNVIYMVASKCSRNHSNSETHKTLQPFKLHLLQKIPLSNYNRLPATVKVLETFLEAILWKPFQFFRRILNDVSSTRLLQWQERSVPDVVGMMIPYINRTVTIHKQFHVCRVFILRQKLTAEWMIRLVKYKTFKDFVKSSLKKITWRIIRYCEINLGFLFNVTFCDNISLCYTSIFRYASGEVNDVDFEQSNVNKLRHCAERNASYNAESNSIEEQDYATGE
jgi:hypothetical protein